MCKVCGSIYNGIPNGRNCSYYVYVGEGLPADIFDVMSHLPIHLVQQLDICGPVHTRWMYPVERYMKTLKGYVRQRAQPEGSMTRGYIMEEALEFCTEYMQNCTVTSRRVWDDKKEPSTNDEVLQGKGRRRVPSPQL